jgi:hypothetical protein
VTKSYHTTYKSRFFSLGVKKPTFVCIGKNCSYFCSVKLIKTVYEKIRTPYCFSVSLRNKPSGAAKRRTKDRFIGAGVGSGKFVK